MDRILVGKNISPTRDINNKPKHRSLSDSGISYKEYDRAEDIFGNVGSIHNDGSLNLYIILKCVHAITYKENSTKICELTMNILEILLNIGVIPNKENEINLQSYKKISKLPKEFHLLVERKEEKYAENFGLAINIIMRLFFFVLKRFYHFKK